MANLESYWVPFTSNRSFKKEPRLLARAEGMYFWNVDGERILDGCSGLFCCALGHGHREIGEAIARQYAELDYGPAFQYSHPGAFELASRLAAITPGDLNRFFFTNSGSESVDTAMKIALRYHRSRGEGQRQRFVGRERAYHGVNFGGLSLGGMVKNREGFGPGLPGVVHLRHTWLEENRFLPGQPEHGAERAEDLQRLVDLYGGDSIAACFVEPIAGVITGFGRTGHAFAAQAFGVLPDVMTLAKALTNGALPMGAVAVREEIYECVTSSAGEGEIELFHGYTYSAHPLACAAASATQKIYREEGVFERASALAPYFQERVFELRDLGIARDIRGYGMLAGLDLEPDDRPGTRGFAALQRLFAAGLVLRVTGDTLILAPALIAEREHVDQICEIVRSVLASL
jgi:beta-alanine--pyruvate transaminase